MPNIDEIMKMAQDAQNKLMEAQQKLDTIEVEGAAGGGMVKIRATAKGRVTGVVIDDSLFAAAIRSSSICLSPPPSTTLAQRPRRPAPRRCATPPAAWACRRA